MAAIFQFVRLAVIRFRRVCELASGLTQHQKKRCQNLVRNALARKLGNYLETDSRKESVELLHNQRLNRERSVRRNDPLPW